MTVTPLDSIASYVTPVQSQQSQPEKASGGDRDTPGQKRKRVNGDPQGPKEKIATKPQEYNVPTYNRERSASLPPSPTNEALKRRKLQEQNQEGRHSNQTGKEQEMAVDDDAQHPTEQGNTPTPANNRSWYNLNQATPQHDAGANPNPQTDQVTVEVDEEENARTLARVMAAAERSMGGSLLNTSGNPLEKYTEGPMPEIFDGDPMTLLANLDKIQIQSWLSLPTGKVLARPFDTEVNYQPNHLNIAKTLMAAAKEITGTMSAAVATPNRDRNAPRGRGNRHPITFLIHDISKKDMETLLERRVWSSKDITFQVAPVNARRPDFLFTLTGLATDNPEHVLASLTETWNDPVTNAVIRNLAAGAFREENQQDRLNQILEFLDSAVVRHLNIRCGGGREDPHFNVFADGEAIEDEDTWLELRKYLRSRVYKTSLFGRGKALPEDYNCSLCHGRDHPRGLCSFPQIPGWNGGGRVPRRTAHGNAPRGVQRNRAPLAPGNIYGNA
ncbi:hypothetical protein EDB84DRAFT_1436104 [Lactarius hengduanensis]|nr:hypothetical protein EDB84DRAFT_1436104 [Lactarius hengduanensis]